MKYFIFFFTWYHPQLYLTMNVPLEGEDEGNFEEKNKNNIDPKLISYEFGRYTQTQTFLFPKNPKSDQC